MRNKILLFLGLAILGGAVFQVFEQRSTIASLEDKNQKLSSLVYTQTQQLEQLQQQLQHEKNVLNDQQNAAENALHSLLAETAETKNSLTALHQQIVGLQAQGLGGDHDVDTQIKNLKEQSEILEKRLKETQIAEKEVSSQSGGALKTEKSQTQLQTQNLNLQIQAQNGMIKATQEQLNFWRKRRVDINQANRVSEYQQQLSNQQQALLQLKEQKNTLAQNDQTQSANIKNEAEQEKGELRLNQEQLEQQINQGKKDLSILMDHKIASQKSSDELKEKILHVQKEYADLYIRYQALQEQYNKKQNEIQNLKKDRN